MTTDENQDGLTTEPNQPDKGNSASTEGKVFTQEEVNNIIKGRLAKEQEKYKDYDNVKLRAGEYENLKTKYDSLEAVSQKHRDTINKLYDDMYASIDEDKRTLVPESLPVEDKIHFINTNRAHLVSVIKTPQTPPPADKPKGEAGLFGGKYKSLVEYAQNDPAGYLAFRQTNP